MVGGSACDWGTMSKSKVKGKIVYCLGFSGQDSTIKDLGGSGVIMSADEESEIANLFVAPATTTTARDGTRINHYINSTKYVCFMKFSLMKKYITTHKPGTWKIMQKVKSME